MYVTQKSATLVVEDTGQLLTEEKWPPFSMLGWPHLEWRLIFPPFLLAEHHLDIDLCLRDRQATRVALPHFSNWNCSWPMLATLLRSKEEEMNSIIITVSTWYPDEQQLELTLNCSILVAESPHEEDGSIHQCSNEVVPGWPQQHIQLTLYSLVHCMVAPSFHNQMMWF